MDKEKLIQHLIKEKGGTKDQYLSLLNSIAYHESAHTMDPSIKQIGGGPGRGKYQFEEGKNRGGITAARRTKKYLDSINQPTPKWLQEAIKGDSLDATKLDSEQQDILFLGNMRMHPKADFSNYVSGKESTEEFWANYHWAGAAKDRETRLESFGKSMASYDGKRPDPLKKETPAFNNVESALTVKDNTGIPQIDYSRMQLAKPTGQNFINLPPEMQASNQPQQQEQQEPKQDLIGYIKENAFNVINKGGTHEQNPNGGVPHGIGANGQQNTVEEGETSFDFGDDKFIFSNRVTLTDYINTRKSQS